MLSYLLLLKYGPYCFINHDYLSYNSKMYLKNTCDEASDKASNQSSDSEINSKSQSKQSPNPDHEPEQDPEDDDFVKKTVNYNNLITIKHKHKFSQEHKLSLTDLKSSTVSPIYNVLNDKEIILKEYRNRSGIYLIHNNVNGKQYVGSGMDLAKRLATYYFPSRLADNRYISNSILKYGHDNFSVVILHVLDNIDIITKKDIISKEQKYIDLYKPVLNLNPIAGSSMGFKHSEESKRLISEFRIGKPLSEKTKKRLSTLFSGELNPFWSKSHTPATLEKMSKSKVGALNPMFNKEKSKEFIAHMYKDKTGENNPMFGKVKSEETLAKIRKKIYVYDSNKQFIKCYDSIGLAVKDLQIAFETIKKYLDTDRTYKDKYFYSELQ